LDAGPLIAALTAEDQYHEWACQTLRRLGPPFYSCPEAMAEVAAMTENPAAVVEMIKEGDICLDFNLSEQADVVLRLLNKYRGQKIDLADACIIRMSELTRDCRVVTTDRKDFAVYRRNGRDQIPIIVPQDG